jgi:hypothetical protein
MKMKLFAATALTLVVTACGTVDPNANNNVISDDDYTTGSNIPHRGAAKNVSTMSAEQIEAAKRGATMGDPSRR